MTYKHTVLKQQGDKETGFDAEIWKDISSYPGQYQVSNFGRVKGLNRIIRKKLMGDLMIKERILTPLKTGGGYLRIKLSPIDGRHRANLIHRLVAIAFVPNPENKDAVNHIDGNKYNNHASNLEWTNYSENTSHSNNLNGGKSNPITNKMELKILKRIVAGYRPCEIMREFNITKMQVSNMRKKYSFVRPFAFLKEETIPVEEKESDAIEFAEWIIEKKHHGDTDYRGILTWNEWVKDRYTCKLFTTKELYQEFLKSK